MHTGTPGTPQNLLPSPRVTGEQEESAGCEQKALGAARFWKHEDGRAHGPCARREGEQRREQQWSWHPQEGALSPLLAPLPAGKGPGRRLLPLPPLPFLSLLPPSLHLPLLSLLAFICLLFLLLAHAPFPWVSRFQVQLSERCGGKGDCSEGVPSWANLGVRSTEVSLLAGAPQQAGSGCRPNSMGC